MNSAECELNIYLDSKVPEYRQKYYSEVNQNLCSYFT